MIDYKILIDGVDYTSSVALPFKEQYVLDSALDNGTMQVAMITRKEQFKPYTAITVVKNGESYIFDIFSDKVTKIVGTSLYTHDLVLIEETKKLEKKIIDTNTTTQPQMHNFDAQVALSPTNLVWDGVTAHSAQKPDSGGVVQADVLSPIELGKNITIPPFQLIYTMNFETWVRDWWVKLYDPDGNIVYDDNKFPDQSVGFVTTKAGVYKLKYWWESTAGLSGNTAGLCEFDIYVVDKDDIKSKKSITYVVNRLLSITETLRESQSPALVFNQEQATFYDQKNSDGEPIYPAPEFAMTKSTLRECLDQVGGYIHSIVRLQGNTIYFDKLGAGEATELPSDYIGEYEILDGEQYATQLDSIVDNLVNIDDARQGTITEPFANGFETVRANGTIRIGDGDGATSIIETEYPIEKIERVECGYLNIGDKDIYVGDITDFIYESAEYQTLSGTIGTYPYSKAYALTYTQGEKNISGLTFKVPNAISDIFTHQAIVNILEAKTGKTLQSILTTQKITELAFQIIYCPSVTARVKQSKSNLNGYEQELTSIYNQNANKVDSRAYGENLKGAIARIGNVEKFITFNVRPPKALPEVGNYVIITNEDYYIATLNVENLSDYKKVTAGLSKDFNALSKYIGIKNNIRLYEVSEKQSVERFVTYDDYCVIGDKIESDGLHLITEQAVKNKITQFNGAIDIYYIGISTKHIYGFSLTDGGEEIEPISGQRYKCIGDSTGEASAFIGAIFTYNGEIYEITSEKYKIYPSQAVSVARLKGYSDNNKALNSVDLPVFSLGVGNSIWLGCRYHDNYSAGNASESGLLSDNSYYQVQNYVQYGDLWGEIETLEIDMYSKFKSTNNSTDQNAIGNALPNSTATASCEPLISTNGDPLRIKKDSRECINLSYQCHFVTNQSGMVIGSQLAQGSPMVSNFSESSASLYIMKTRINKFASVIDLTNGTFVKNYNGDTTAITANGNAITFANETATDNGKCWVLVDNATSKLLFGKNIAIEKGMTIEMPTMTFTHKVLKGE